ncbi:MAG: peptide chain release factor N(5)-glutamine methyltransferase [Oscillospiraceae bacterium]|jgi:release factor glutamine methyltransferase|nr:peptide chain release factor N(5)-glutamine methyltransferase [Oscillospiraceae bacterium]
MSRRVLREQGVAGFDLEARLLCEKASGKTREAFIRDAAHYPPDGRFERELMSFLARRAGGEPIAYITGEWAFYSLPMEVSPDVLIPRADTEILAERAIKILKGAAGGGAPLRVLDLCCGTGCVGLAIAANVPDARVTLADNSDAALRLARANTARNALTRRAAVSSADALAPPPPLFGSFEMIVCNPPYIPTADLDGLEPSVRAYEPRAALDGGEDGLAFYRRVAASWKTLLQKGGFLLFECGAGQAQAVMNILREHRYTGIAAAKDLQGIDRVVEGCVTS